MTRRRSSAPRRWAIIVSSLVATAVVGLVVAEAAQLNVTNTGLVVGSESRCTNGPIVVLIGSGSGNSTRYPVTVSDVPALCANLPVSLVLYRSDGSSEATGTGTVPAGGGSFTVTTTGYNRDDVSGVALLIGTWGIPATWNAPPETPAASCVALNNGGNPQPAKTCTITLSLNGSAPWPNSTPPGGTLWNFSFNVTSETGNWEATINFTDPAFPFLPQWIGQNSVTVARAPGYTCGSPVSTLVVRPTGGATWGGSLDVGSLGAPSWWSGNNLCP